MYRVGTPGSSRANYGDGVAIFEAVHGSAPKYAGKNVINPSAVVLSGVMMLKHLGEFEAAEAVEHAVLATLCDIRTPVSLSDDECDLIAAIVREAIDAVVSAKDAASSDDKERHRRD